MNSWQKNFIFLSQIVGLPVIDSTTNRRVGRVADLVAGLREMYPRISALMLRRPFPRGMLYIPWKNVRTVLEDRAVYIDDLAAVLREDQKISENEILLRDTFWDKQIVDISGSKVVRVNDLHLLREDRNLWVVHMDIGFKGLLRRLGWARVVTYLVRWLFSYDLKERFISWKFVQPTTTDRGAGLLSLKTPGSRLSELHPADLADILIDLGTDERVVVLNALDIEGAAGTLMELPMKIRVQTAELLPQDRFARIVDAMPIDEAVDLLAHFPKKKMNVVLSRMTPEKSLQIRSLIQLPGRSAGSLMNVEFVAVRSSLSAGQVLDKVRTEGKAKESIYYVYTLDDNDALTGVVTLRQLLTAPADRPVGELMRRRIVRVRVDTDVKEVAQVFYKYNFTVVPVVDRQSRLLGIVTIKDALEAVFPEIREESEES